MEIIQQKEEERLSQLLEGLRTIDGIIIFGKETTKDRVSVVSIQTDWMDEGELAFVLDEQYGIMTRVGMHCAPNAHKTLGSFPRGTLRFSIGYQTTKEEIEMVIEALKKIKETQSIM